MKSIVISVTLAVTILAFAAWNSYPEHILPFPQSPSGGKMMAPDSKVDSDDLASLALNKVLDDAVPIFGEYSSVQTDTSNWMAAYPDDTLLVHMNIPGTHDAATWNYSDATQQELKKVTSLVNETLEFSSEGFRCQSVSFSKMLDSGIRVFDLRYAFDPTNTSITFWHGPALLSETASLDDVMFGFYKWLDDHPSEALLLSFQYERSEHMDNADSREIQKMLYRTLTSPAAKKYIRQTRDGLGTLGDARGQITLLRRFDLNQLSLEYESSIPGLHFSPNDWIVNGADSIIAYNPSANPDGETGKAYIQDYYMPKTAKNSSTAHNVEEKLNKTIPHFELANQLEHRDDLFWHFMSCTNILHNPPISPRMMALGEGAIEYHSERAATGDLKGVEGVNHRLVPFFKEMKGKRLGIVMFDFFEQPQELLPLFLSLLPPEDFPRPANPPYS